MAEPSAGLSPHEAVFRALVQSLQGTPPGGLPTTQPLVDHLGSLTPEQTPTGGGPTAGLNPATGQPWSPNLIGPNGEWQAGKGELGPMDLGGGAGGTGMGDFFNSLVGQLGGAR